MKFAYVGPLLTAGHLIKTVVSTGAILLATSSLCLSQNESTNSDGRRGSEELAITQLDREATSAFVEGDVKTLARILDDQLTDTSYDGTVSNKQQDLEQAQIQPKTHMTVDFFANEG